jgi:hypothetical protein
MSLSIALCWFNRRQGASIISVDGWDTQLSLSKYLALHRARYRPGPDTNEQFVQNVLIERNQFYGTAGGSRVGSIWCLQKYRDQQHQYL